VVHAEGTLWAKGTKGLAQIETSRRIFACLPGGTVCHRSISASWPPAHTRLHYPYPYVAGPAAVGTVRWHRRGISSRRSWGC